MYRYSDSSIETRDNNVALFNQLSDFDLEQAVALVNPMPDGNCGYRAVSLSAFGHQDGWVQVKKMMLNTLLSHKQVYESYGLDIGVYKERLNCTDSPCDSLSCGTKLSDVVN